MSKLMRTAEAAAMLCLDESTLRDWRCQRKGPPFIVLSPRRVVYAEVDILRYANERRVTPGMQAQGNIHGARKKTA